MSIDPSQQTDETRQIEDLLRRAFPAAQVDAYRHNTASIRVRVIDAGFRRKSLVDREEAVLPLLKNALPEDVVGDIMVLLLLTPEEAPQNFMNLEFEHPEPSLI